MLGILMVVSEAIPYSKTGGLGDVGGALPTALAHLGHHVTVVTPRYRGIEEGKPVAAFGRGSWLGAPDFRVLERVHGDGVRFWFVDCPAYYDREELYEGPQGDHPDNYMRGMRPAIVHAHDWQAGLVPAYLKERFRGHPAFSEAGTVFTIHNLAYQGIFGREVLPALDLPWDVFTGEGLEFWNNVSFLKAGINFSEIVTTVSRRYAQEIQTPEQGFGFEGILQRRAGALVGIRNGVDTTTWNPENDPLLPARFSAADLAGKAEVKRALLARVGLDAPGQWARPVIGMVSRMVDQKGLDLIAGAVATGALQALDASFVILGTGTPQYEGMWRKLAAKHPSRVSVTVGFNEELAHLIEGGADMFLMPSRFEPCGLNQMYSLRYGTVPVVRATGGLDDTVTDVDEATGDGTGFKFRAHTTDAMLEALHRALSWYARPAAWRRIQLAGMAQDNSWEASAREYVEVYARARERASRA
ncbi:MAG: glycogen synthase GlgA [Vicinamibacterales bacterium]|nr:glycogen synthase GlgA [Vicinamibacterales bacterium]